MSNSPPTPVRIKQLSEDRTLTFEFAKKMLPGDAIAGTPVVVIEPDGDITHSLPQFDGATRVNVRFGGGVEGKNYRISVQVVTQQNEKLELDVDLQVRDGWN